MTCACAGRVGCEEGFVSPCGRGAQSALYDNANDKKIGQGIVFFMMGGMVLFPNGHEKLVRMGVEEGVLLK
jgi:hypothetical protein